MNRRMVPLLVLIFFLALKVHADGIAIENAWSPAAPPVVTVHAGYLTLANRSANTITIIGFESPLYHSISLHLSRMENGQMEMRELSSLKLNPDETVQLERGAMHLMMYGPEQFPAIGDRIPVAIITEDGQRKSFELVVKAWQ